MKRKTLFALALVATIAVGTALVLPALAHGTGDRSGYGAMAGQSGGMMPMHGQTRGHMNGGMMGQMGGFGQMGSMGVMMEKFDADGDGTVTPDEVRAGLKAALQEYDSGGDGTLSLQEYQAFYANMTRERMVDHFQALDNDGDGQLTVDEITAPADRFEWMQKMMQRVPGNMHDGNAGPMKDQD